ncbi:UNVERIFIED_CONTAM: hypothetical protein Q9R58_17685 [Methylobacteriaceae bacterium AG10]|nr:hypothetical protein [Methylobacteriaceae bacterium AG10]
MRSAATSLDEISPERAAAMLFDSLVGLKAIETDSGMAEHLVRAIAGRPYRIRQLPDDFEAVRAEMRRLWAEHERAGRSQECRRYHPNASKRG